MRKQKNSKGIQGFSKLASRNHQQKSPGRRGQREDINQRQHKKK